MNFTEDAKKLAYAFLAIIFIASGSLFVVRQPEQALVLQFGKPKETITKPGLYFKLPFFFQNVVKYDKRILEVNLKPKTLPDVNQKQVIIDAFVKYRINDSLKFYRTVKDYNNLFVKIDSVLNASLKNTVGRIEFMDLLSNKRKKIMNEIRQNVSDKADEFGVEIVDLRIMKADLPEENLNSIFKRMIAEREKEAKEFRAQGEEEANKIRSRAEKQKTILIAEAKKKSEILKGEGDAVASKIFADSFGRDIDFFTFYRSMQAYKDSLNKEDTSFVISPDNEFFKYIDNINGKQ